MDSHSTYESAYVACLDILGFSEVVRGNTHETLEALYLVTFCNAIYHGLSDGKYEQWSDGEANCIRPDIRAAKVNSLLVSDTILIWTEDSGTNSFCDIVIAVRKLIALCLIDGFLLRGAIAVGPLTVLRNEWPSQTSSLQLSLFGKAVVDATETEKLQEWAGCMITHAAIYNYKSDCSEPKVLIEKKVIVPYFIPLKDKEIPGYAIDWVNEGEVCIDFQTVRAAFAPKNEKPCDVKVFETKMRNTLKFVKHVKPSADQMQSPVWQIAIGKNVNHKKVTSE